MPRHARFTLHADKSRVAFIEDEVIAVPTPGHKHGLADGDERSPRSQPQNVHLFSDGVSTSIEQVFYKTLRHG